MTAQHSAAAGLGGVIKRGVAISASGVVIVQVISIVQTLVLGRLLGPVEVGVYTAGSVLMGFVMIVAEGTLSQALIQREHDVEDAATTAFVATALSGLLLSLAALATAPIIGMLFHSERVGTIAAATSGLMLLHSFSTVPDAMMQRAFQFTRRIIIGPVMCATFAVVAIVFAALGFGAWAMVIGSYASMTMWVVLSWTLSKWRPFRGRASFRTWREMAKFSYPVAVEGLAERVRESLEALIVGRLLGTAALGQYRYAFRIGSLPAGGIIQSCSFVLFPAFSRIAGDKQRLKQAFLRALGWLWFAALPIAAVMILAGEQIVVLLLGAQWQPAGVATEAMAGMGLGLALLAVAAEAIKGAGRSSLLMWLAAIHLGFGLPAVLIMLPYGLVGVGLAVSVTHLVLGAVSVILARPIVGISFREVGACLVPSTMAAAVALVAMLPVKYLLFESHDMSMLRGLASIVVVCLAFSALYLIMIRIFAPTRFHEVRHFARRALAAAKARRGAKVDAS
jgi:O-antigen/teichoic acid export membrane protein